MNKKFGQALREARKANKMTQSALGAVLGVSRAAVTQWEGGANYPSTNNVIVLSRILAVDLLHLTNDDDIVKKDFKDRFLVNNNQAKGAIATETVENGVPVYGATLAFKEEKDGFPAEDMLLSNRIINRIRRPEYLEHASGAYAFHMASVRLEPRFFLGELVYVNKDQTPSRFDYVVIRMNNRRTELEDSVFVGRFIGFYENATIRLSQHNPEANLELDESSVASMERIYPWYELLQGGGKSNLPA